MDIAGYRNVSDECLASLVKKGDERAFEEIFLRYIKLIYTVAAKYSVDGYDTDDLVQEGLLAFLSAAKAFSRDFGSYKNFALKCAKNRFADLLKSAKSKSAVPKSDIVPMDDLAAASGAHYSVEDDIIERDYLKTLLNHLFSSLNNEDPVRSLLCLALL